MKNLVKSLVLFAFICVFVSCNNDGNNNRRISFSGEPGFVESLDNDTVVKTAHGRFLVNSLDKSLKVGNPLWSVFEIDLDSEKKPVGKESLYSAIGFRYTQVDSSKVIMSADFAAFEAKLADDYTEDIDLAVLYKDYVDHLLFFGFQNESSNKTGYVYELLLNPDKEKGTEHPTLYIRAKKQPVAPASQSNNNKTIFAFDMTDFVKYYRDKISKDGPVKFNLKYKTETKNNKDVYSEFKSNPMLWHIQ